MNNISITLNQQELDNITILLQQYEVSSSNDSILHLYKFKDATVTIYKTKVLLIQSKNAKEIYKEIFDHEYQDVDQKTKLENHDIKINQYNIATMGSDEVGTGDFFGGIVVAAAYVNPKQIEWLKSIGVNDSKKLSDDRIVEIFNQIKDEIIFDVINIEPEEYNNQFEQYQNSNIIKAVAHNQALWNLSKKIKRPYFVIIDQFVNYETYSKYIRMAHKTEYSIDIFETKAESKYYSVACASIIARAFFLNQIKQISNNLGLDLLLGSSNINIKEQARLILEKYGLETLKNISKNHFVTFSEILEGN